MGLAALQHTGSSQMRSQTCVPCIGRNILIHCTTREVLVSSLRRCYKETPKLVTSFGGDFRFLQGTLILDLCYSKCSLQVPSLSPGSGVEMQTSNCLRDIDSLLLGILRNTFRKVGREAVSATGNPQTGKMRTEGLDLGLGEE